MIDTTVPGTVAGIEEAVADEALAPTAFRAETRNMSLMPLVKPLMTAAVTDVPVFAIAVDQLEPDDEESSMK